jgi:hypothetical protein
MRRELDQIAKQPGGLFDIVFFNGENGITIKTERQRRNRTALQPAQEVLKRFFWNCELAIGLIENVTKTACQILPHSPVKEKRTPGTWLERMQIIAGQSTAARFKSGVHRPDFLWSISPRCRQAISIWLHGKLPKSVHAGFTPTFAPTLPPIFAPSLAPSLACEFLPPFSAGVD